MTFVMLLGLLTAPAIATTYYVDQDHSNADDSNAGTSESAPWETLRKATQTVQAGDTVYVKAGTYIDTIEPNFEDKFQVVNNGTAANPITFISSPPRAAVVRSESLPTSRNDYAWGIGEGAQYIIIDGFKIEGGIVLGYDGCDNCTIRNCEVVYGRVGDSDPSLNWGLTVYGADYCTIENNYVHNMTDSGNNGHNTACIMVFVDSDFNIIQSNTADASNGIVFSAFGQKGGQMDDNIWRYNVALNATTGFLGMGSTSGEYPTQDNTYYQNIIIDCDSAFFLDHRAERFVMYNNTAVDCDWFLGASQITNIDTELWNNILVGTDDIAIRWSGYPTAEPFSTLIEYSNYNCFYNCSKIAYREKSPSLNYYTLNDWETATGFDADSITSDPDLVGGGDYSLDTGSPCIDAGVDLQDYDDDENTSESINMGAYITGNETIGHDWGASAPTKATGPSPTNSATSVSITADLSWTAGSGSTSSDVYFGTDSTPDSGEDQGNQTATTYDPGTMSTSTTYYWRIDEINANGTTTGDVWSFTTTSGSAPGAASSPSPANSVTSVSITADLSWTAGSGATSRNVYFGTSSPGTSQGNQTATTYDTGTMDANTTYYWRIDEVNSAGTTTGTVWSFTTAAGSGETIKINFQPSASTVPTGYEKDYGQTYGSQGNGLSYGWSVSKTSHTRDRGIDSDQRYDTNIYWPSNGPYWEIALDNGTYDIWLVCGDAEYDDSTNTLDIESTTVTDPDGEDYFDEFNFQVDVNDGKLTIAPATGAYPKLCFIEITSATVEAPDQATNPSPANSATGVSITADLSWTAGSGATSHDVYFGTTSPGTSQGNQTATSFDTGTMTNNTTYYWRIDEVNSGGTTTGTVWSFTTIVAAPGAASSPSPANSAAGVSITADLSWTAGSGATSRDVYFGTSSPGSYQGNQTATTFDTGTMTNNTTYYWRIDEVNAGGTTTGTVWSFTTIVVAPGAASSPSPANSTTGVSITADLSWTAGSGATSRDVYFGTTSPGTSQGNQTATTFDTGTMTNYTTYYWRIDEVNAATTTTGTVWSFTTIVAAPAAASNPSPSNSATGVSITADLSWTAGSGATSRDVYFGTTSPGASQGNQTAATFDTGTMDNDTTYYWRIDEVNTGGTTTGTVWSFTTEQEATPDANLVGWWRFENNADDSAGTNDGTIYGAVSATGKIGQALSFDEVNDYVTVPDFDYTNDSDEFSLNFWFKIADVAGSAYQYIYSHGTVTADNSLNVYFSETDEGAGGEELRTWIALGDSTEWYSVSDPDYVDGQWHMYTITVSSVNGAAIYVDANSILTNPNLKGSSMNPASSIYIGGRNDLNADRYYGNSSTDDGLLDDVRLYDRALSQTDISVLFSGVSPIATNPNPADSANDVSVDAVLTWTAGDYADTHDVYLGTDANDVADANNNSDEFMDNVDVNSFDPNTLDYNTTYYWAIDEVNDTTTWVGDVWSFTTEAQQAPGAASSPSPANSAADVSITADLSWTAGSGATSHDVYFGTTSPGTSQGNQTATTFDTGTMDANSTYYWRIDEVNAAGTTTGTVWSFTTAQTIKINFQPSASSVPSGYEVDSGATYGSRGNGLSYGWDTASTQTRDRGVDSDQRYDTLNHFYTNTWEIGLDNGTYDVWVVFGDPEYADMTNTMDIEGTTCTDPDGEDYFDEYNIQVSVTDGRLTIEPATGADNPKICFIEITP